MILLIHAQIPTAHGEDSINLIAAGTHRAVIEVNQQRYVLTPREPDQNGISLVSSTTEKVVVRINGELMELDMFSSPAQVLLETDSLPDESAVSAVLWMSSDGFFYADGSINGKLTRFVVDTGATSVTLSGHQADRLGINWKSGKRGYSSTVGGLVRHTKFKTDEITVQGITLRHIPVTVVPGAYPEIPLLGGTFLNRLNMSRTGIRMDLIQP